MKAMKWIFGLVAAVSLVSPAVAQARFPIPAREQMTPEQKKVVDKILASRGNLSGPFSSWLPSPEMADRFQSAGEYVRYHSVIPGALHEFVILVTARDWTSQVEWQIHYPEAIKAGVKKQILDDLAANKRPAGMSMDQALVYDFSIAMHKDKGRVSDAVFNAAKKRFGEKGVAELIGINAYYDMAAMAINAGRVPLPIPGPDPLK